MELLQIIAAPSLTRLVAKSSVRLKAFQKIFGLSRCNRFCNHAGTIRETTGNSRFIQIFKNKLFVFLVVSVDLSILDYESAALTVELRARGFHRLSE
jgi:hypothetical protein